MIATTAGHGVIKKPASTWVRPKSTWNRKGSATKARPWVANEQTEVSEDSANTGMRNRSTASIGAGCSRWRCSRAAAHRAATASSAPTTHHDVSWAMALMPKMNNENAAAVSTAAGRSNRAPDSTVIGRLRRPSTMATRPMGTLIRNSQCQVATDRIAEATDGPTVNDSATTSAFSPAPRPRMAAGKMKRISARLTLMIAAAPTPWMPRATASTGNDHAMPQISDATVNNVMPPRYSRLWPMMSPSEANGSSMATTAS